MKLRSDVAGATLGKVIRVKSEDRPRVILAQHLAGARSAKQATLSDKSESIMAFDSSVVLPASTHPPGRQPSPLFSNPLDMGPYPFTSSEGT